MYKFTNHITITYTVCASQLSIIIIISYIDNMRSQQVHLPVQYLIPFNMCLYMDLYLLHTYTRNILMRIEKKIFINQITFYSKQFTCRADGAIRFPVSFTHAHPDILMDIVYRIRILYTYIASYSLA